MTRSKFPLLPVAGLWCLTCLHGIAHAAVDDAAAYEQLIVELQTQQLRSGTAVELGEAYYGLGNSLQTLERHAEAVEAFDNALQVLRENAGLYDLAQLPVLHARLDSSQALSSWQDVDAGKQLVHLITLKNPTASTEQRYQTLRELGLWKLRAGEEDLLPNSLDGVRDAAALYRAELERPGVGAAYEGRGLALANLYLDLAALEFLQAKQKMALPLTDYQQGGPRTVTQMYCETIQGPDGRARQVCRSMQVPNLDYFMSMSDRKYGETRLHLDAMKSAVLEAHAVLLREVLTPNRDATVPLLTEVRRLTDAFNDFVEENGRRTGTRIAARTGSRIR